MARKLSEIVQLKLRFREELRRKLEKAAKRNARSLNAEIINRLENSFSTEDKLAIQKESLMQGLILSIESKFEGKELCNR